MLPSSLDQFLERARRASRPREEYLTIHPEEDLRILRQIDAYRIALVGLYHQSLIRDVSREDVQNAVDEMRNLISILDARLNDGVISI